MNTWFVRCVFLVVLGALGPARATADDLLQIYRQAALTNPAVRAAQAGVAADREALQQAQAQRYLPQANMSVGVARTRQQILSSSNSSAFPQNTFYYNNSGLSLSLTQPLYNQDARARVAVATAQVRKSLADVEITQADMQLTAAERYFAVLAAEDALAYAQAEQSALAQQLAQSKARFEVGMLAINDLHEAQAGYDQAGAAVVVAQNQVSAAREALRALTTHIPGALKPLRAEILLNAPEPSDSERWVEEGAARNPQVIAAQAAVEMAEENIQVQRGAHQPRIDVVGSYDYEDISGGNFGDRTSQNMAIGLQLNLNLYQGGQITSRIRQAAQQRVQSLENLDQTRRTVVQTIRNDYLGVHTAMARIQAFSQAVTSAQSKVEATKVGADIGTRTTLDVINAQRDLYRTKRDLAQARYDYVLNGLRLKRAAGLLSEADLEQVNSLLQSHDG